MTASWSDSVTIYSKSATLATMRRIFGGWLAEA